MCFESLTELSSRSFTVCVGPEPASPGRRGSSALLRGTDFGFQLDQLLRHLVGGPLGQDPHHRHAGLIGVDARAERAPAHAALAVGDVSQLDHGHADHPVGPAEAVVLHHHLELVAVGGLLPQDAAVQRRPVKKQPAAVSQRPVVGLQLTTERLR